MAQKVWCSSHLQRAVLSCLYAFLKLVQMAGTAAHSDSFSAVMKTSCHLSVLSADISTGCSSIKEEGDGLEEIGAGSPCDKRYFISEMTGKKCSFCPVFQNEGKFTSAICIFLRRPAAFALPKAVQDYRFKKKTGEICFGNKMKEDVLLHPPSAVLSSRADYCQT